MDQQEYNNQNNAKGDLINQPQPDNYPSENEINNNKENALQENHFPPPVPLYQSPQASPPISIGNDISYQPPNNQNVELVPVQQQIVVPNQEVKTGELYNNQIQPVAVEECCCCDCDCCRDCYCSCDIEDLSDNNTDNCCACLLKFLCCCCCCCC